jgi:NADPH:quinone reductase-like Zn-dependent oxidoreductase
MRVAKAQWHGFIAPQRVRVFSGTVTTQQLDELGNLLAAHRITPLVDTVYPLDQATEALARVATHHARGKVVVAVAPEGTATR